VNHRELLVKLTLNMPKINSRADSRVDKAIVALTKYPNITIPEAMKLADFTPPEILCKAKYMWVYWQAEKILNRSKAFLTPPTTRCVEVVSGVSIASQFQDTQAVGDSFCRPSIVSLQPYSPCTPAASRHSGRPQLYWKKDDR